MLGLGGLSAFFFPLCSPPLPLQPTITSLFAHHLKTQTRLCRPISLMRAPVGPRPCHHHKSFRSSSRSQNSFWVLPAFPLVGFRADISPLLDRLCGCRSPPFIYDIGPPVVLPETSPNQNTPPPLPNIRSQSVHMHAVPARGHYRVHDGNRQYSQSLTELLDTLYT